MEIKELKSLSWLLKRDAHEIYRQCMYRAAFSEYADEIRRMFNDPDFHIFVCAEADGNTGILILESVSPKTAKIAGIAVEKEHQKQGIGKCMVFSAARSLGVKTVIAETDNEAVGFYEHTGFTVTPFVRHFRDGDAVRYNCCLSL